LTVIELLKNISQDQQELLLYKIKKMPQRSNFK